MASTPFTATDSESAAIDALSKRVDRMLRRMEEALSRMSSAPATAASATAARAPSSTSSLAPPTSPATLDASATGSSASSALPSSRASPTPVAAPSPTASTSSTPTSTKVAASAPSTPTSAQVAASPPSTPTSAQVAASLASAPLPTPAGANNGRRCRHQRALTNGSFAPDIHHLGCGSTPASATAPRRTASSVPSTPCPPFLAAKKKIAKKTRRPQARARAAVRLPAERVAVAAAHGRPPPQQAGRGPRPRYRRRRHRHRARVHLQRVPRRARQHERRPHGPVQRVRPRRVLRRARQHGRRPHKPVHRVRCRQLAHGALGAEAEVLNVSPTMCSTQCHNRSTTPALCPVVCPLGVHKTCTLERKLIRYITSCYHPHLIVVVPVEVANYVLEDCMMLDTMSEPNPAIPWQDSNTLISETIRLCFTFWVLFCYGLAGVHKRLPWPPPVPLERLLSMLCCCSVRECKLKLLDGHIVISNSVTVFCWTHCIELLGSYHKHIQSLSLALQKADFILSNELQWLFLWPPPQIRVTVLHFDAAKKAIDKLQLRSNFLDFTDEQQADCTDLKFIEARYNTKLKNVLLRDCALACGPSRCSEVESLIHTKLGNACSCLLDDRYETDNTQFLLRGESKFSSAIILTRQRKIQLMESFLIVKIVAWVSDSMPTCVWRVGIHDQDWHFILCFRIIYTSSALQLLLVSMRHQRNESTSSLVNTQIMHFAILYAQLMKECAVTSSALDAFEQAWVAHWLWRNSEKLLLWSEANSCNVLKPLSANLIAYISVNGMGSPRADMSWPQGDFGSMELQDSDQYGCTKQRHSESVIVTELSCGLAFELQNGAEDFQLSACFWRGLTCYSDSIVKFSLSGCLQIHGLDQRKDVDKFQLDVKIYDTSQPYYLDLGKLVMDYLVVQMRTSYFEYYTHQTMYRAIGISVHTPSQSKLQVFHVEGQIGNSLSPPGSTGNIITEFRFYNLMIEDP